MYHFLSDRAIGLSIRSSAGNGKSWKLPPNTGDGSYTNLFLTKAGLVTTTNGNNPTFTNTIQAEPYGFVLSGSYYSAILYQGRNGGFWSRSSYKSNNNASYYFDFWNATDADNPGNFGFPATSGKYGGRAVRCGLHPTLLDILRSNFKRSENV